MSESMSAARSRAMLRMAIGPTIAAALADPQVIEIMINPDGHLWLDRLEQERFDTGVGYDTAQVERIIRLVASQAWRHHRAAVTMLEKLFERTR